MTIAISRACVRFDSPNDKNLNIYAGRGRGKPGIKSPALSLGNPFVIGKDGDRGEVIRKHRQWLWMNFTRFRKALTAIANSKRPVVLWCFCSASEECHCDTLIKAVEYVRGKA